MGMPMKKRPFVSKWVDPDDAPGLDRDWFERAEIREGGQLIRPAKIAGAPKRVAPKTPISIRQDADVIAYFRATGPGWQSRINDALRKAAGLP
jgi:uncharacterized protein (DUF4415 family)